MGSLEMICLWCLCRPCSPWDQVIIKLLCSLCCRCEAHSAVHILLQLHSLIYLAFLQPPVLKVAC